MIRPSLPISIEKPVPQNSVAWMVEPDRRRGTFGLYVGSGQLGSCDLVSTVWLSPEAAEGAALALLEAVAAWRTDQAAIASAAVNGGRCHDSF